MVTRTVPAVLLLLLVTAGCANNASDTGAASAPAPSASASDVVDLPVPSAKTSGPAGEPTGRPNAGGQTITGTVTAGVEPNCLVLTDGTGSHLLIFDDAAMRADAVVGSTVTVSGQSQPGMMSTCQQGVPFVVVSVKKG
ncbi:hypothetical protein KOI35_40105 [Actinoplanes bogorensis]|uniref:Uncharacterized protein n=1 Tax=Paractinoplanes bogorensis TaxID=1610840 RepID=A0ABS5Z206_9ACTN|nr:hypothetical protein [Actinoplanes bogorensis]MBU2669731.1 hypothetical protein [Actinoplanes bogorensis]